MAGRATQLRVLRKKPFVRSMFSVPSAVAQHHRRRFRPDLKYGFCSRQIRRWYTDMPCEEKRKIGQLAGHSRCRQNYELASMRITRQ